MPWDTAADLIRDLTTWEARALPLGGHWPWTPGVLTAIGAGEDYATTPAPLARIAGERLVSVRRALWQTVWGPLPERVNIVVTCAEERCVRPAHGHCGPAAGRHAAARLLDDPALTLWNATAPAPDRERRGRRDAAGHQLSVADSNVRPHLRRHTYAQHQHEDLTDLGER